MNGNRGLFLSLGGLAVAIVALPALILGIHTNQQWAKLEDYRTELSRKGERLRIAELAPPQPASGAVGEKLIAAATKLSDQVNHSKIKPAAALILNDAGQSEVAHLRNTVKRLATETTWEEFSREIEPFRFLLAEFREASHPDELRLRLDYSREVDISLDFLVPSLRAGQQLTNECLPLLREGKTSAAVENIQAMLKLAAMVGDEPIMISQMVSSSLIGLAQSTTWLALQEEASRADLQALLSSWQSIKPGKHAAATLRLERAWFHTFLNSKIPEPETENDSDPLIHLIWQLCSRYKDERQTLRDFQEIIEACDAETSWPEILSRANRLHIEALDAGISRLKGAQVEVLLTKLVLFPQAQSLQNLSLAAIAIRLYQLDHAGAPPDSLEALVPEYLANLPSDPMDNRPLRYRRSGSGFALYAIGANHIDDSGNGAPPAGKRNSALIDRLDIVWPQVTP